MTRTTTETSRRTRWISWGIALLVFAGMGFFLWLFEPSGGNTAGLPDKQQHPVRTASRKMKQQQAQRPLPPDYAEQLVRQSEVLVKKELESRLRKFQEMSGKMRQRRDELLEQVENRPLPASAPADANDTSPARTISQPSDLPPGTEYSVEELYELLREYEKEIQYNHLAVNAAKQTLSKGLSFPEVYNSLKPGSTYMPGFEELIRNQLAGSEWIRTTGSNASAGLQISNTADLNNYRGLLGQASRQTGLAGARLEGLFGIPQARGVKPGNDGQQGGGPGEGDGGMGTNYTNTGPKTPMSKYKGQRLDPEMVKAQALPGRRFSKSAERSGWLYINTWYMIGPWENYGRDDFAIIHPPEISVDFDAVYTDGQKGRGIAETDSHPIWVIGDEVELDGTLRWKFMQSESMHNTVPVTTDRSTYYAYTELYFDESTPMLVAIGTDDSGRVWINGKDVWQDTGTSWYRIDEHITTFRFQQGWNTVLIRLENGGGGAAGFSFLILPEGSAVPD